MYVPGVSEDRLLTVHICEYTYAGHCGRWRAQQCLQRVQEGGPDGHFHGVSIGKSIPTL